MCVNCLCAVCAVSYTVKQRCCAACTLFFGCALVGVNAGCCCFQVLMSDIRRLSLGSRQCIWLAVLVPESFIYIAKEVLFLFLLHA